MPVDLQRRLTAVLLADVVGYSRLMSEDEDGTHSRLARYLDELIDPTIKRYHGRAVRSMGDGLLVEFGSAIDAVRCALDIQRGLEGQAQEPKIQLRIGINTGDVIVDQRDIYGTSVNIAARIEGIAQPGTVFASQGIYDQTRSHSDLYFADLGAQQVKNIGYPIHVFKVSYGPVTDYIPLFRIRLRKPWIAAVVGVIVAIASVIGFLRLDRSGTVQAKSIIVLPFRNLSGSSDDEYLADAITDDLTTDLARVSHAFVIASATALTYKAKLVDARQIGVECGVRYLLEGSIRRVAGTVSINAQLIDTTTGAHVWADRFSRDSTTLPDLEEAVTDRIASSLDLQLTKEEIRHEVGTGSLAADGNPLDERLRAMALILGPPTPEKFLEARRHVQNALKLDPKFPEALALQADLLVSDYLNKWNNATIADVDAAEGLIAAALFIDSNVWMAYYARGFTNSVRGQHQASFNDFKKATQLNPAWARAYAQMGNQELFLGDPKQAVQYGFQAIQVSPKDPSIGVFNWVVGRAYFSLPVPEYGNAVKYLYQSVQVRPNLWFSQAWLIAAYWLKADKTNAQAALTQFRAAFPAYTLQWITDYYATEARYQNPTIQTAVKTMLQALQDAGLR